MARPLKHTHSMTLRLTPELRAGIDKWARKRRLSRAEAIRRLVEQALYLDARLRYTSKLSPALRASIIAWRDKKAAEASQRLEKLDSRKRGGPTSDANRGKEGMALHPNPIDMHVGARVRARRKLTGMSQSKLGEALNLTFQQVQKYEKGTNRIGSSRLYQMSKVLDVPMSYFFDDMPAEISGKRAPGLANGAGFESDPLAQQETHQLVQSYYRIANPYLRNRVRKLVKALAGPN